MGRGRGPVEVRIALPELGEGRRSRLQRRVERSMTACGCDEGTVAGLFYLALSATLLATGRVAPPGLLGWMVVGFGFIAALGGGKAFGLLMARLVLFKTLNEIKNAFAPDTKGR
jgi:hypothetical protein